LRSCSFPLVWEKKWTLKRLVQKKIICCFELTRKSSLRLCWFPQVWGEKMDAKEVCKWFFCLMVLNWQDSQVWDYAHFRKHEGKDGRERGL
jgi:hypothetical protein